MRNYLAVAVVVAAAVVPSFNVSAQERREISEFRSYGNPSDADRSGVDELIEKFKTSWARQDAAAVAALHADDVEWINAFARLIRGSKPLEQFLEKRLFPAFDPAVSKQEVTNMKLLSIRYLGNDAAIAHLYTDGQRGSSRNADEANRRTHLHLILEEQVVGWRIVHVAIMDAR
jgi:uncharacterized protein (TIGR02246 family)